MSKGKKSKIKKNTFAIIGVVLFYTFYENAGTHTILGKYNRIIETSTAAVHKLGEINDSVNDIDNTIVKLVNEQTTSSLTISLTESLGDKVEKCKEEMKDYEKIKVPDEQKTLFNDFKKQFDKYSESIAKIKSAANVNDFGKARELYSSELISTGTAAESTVETLMDNTLTSQDGELSYMRKHIILNNIVMYIIAFAFILVLLGVDRRRARMTQDLIESKEKVEKQKDKIVTAVFKDVLTDVNNRLSFVNKFSSGSEKVFMGFTEYFIMFNIDEFCKINSKHGLASGDLVLNSTAERLKEVFTDADIYRTGSDEFVVVMTISEDAGGYNRISALIEKARTSLANPHKITNGSLKIKYTVSVARKTGPGQVDTSVLGPLAYTIKQTRVNKPGTIMLTDLP